MLKRVMFIAAAGALLLAGGYADQSTKSNGKVVIPVTRADATDGRQMYTSYCAPCHGTDGRGHGPAAAALKSQPADLTSLAKLHNGKFPDSHVVSVLEFGSAVSAHGSAQMPVWGPLLGKMSNVHTQEKQLRISNLSRYLETIQAK